MLIKDALREKRVKRKERRKKGIKREKEGWGEKEKNKKFVIPLNNLQFIQLIDYIRGENAILWVT